MREHLLKCWPNAFEAISAGSKRFEWRRDDRGFEVGDVLVLKRWDPARHNGSFVDYCDDTERNTLRVRVTYILRGIFGVPQDFCVMSIAREAPAPEAKPPEPEAGEPSDEELDGTYGTACEAAEEDGADDGGIAGMRALYNLGKLHASRLTEAERRVVEAAKQLVSDLLDLDAYGKQIGSWNDALISAVDALAELERKENP